MGGLGLFDSEPPLVRSEPLLKEHRGSFLTNSTCCSGVSGGVDMSMLESDVMSNSRLSSLYGGADRSGHRLTILEEDMEMDDAVQSQKQIQRKLFELHTVRALKQIPLPDWMKIFVPRVVRLQTGTVPFMEYARSEKGEVRQRLMISVWTRVDRLPKNKLSIDFRMPVSREHERAPPVPSTAASKGTNDKVSPEKWILKFDTKNERDMWAKHVQDAIDLLSWITKFTLGNVVMASENSSIVECFTWMDRGRPSYVMKSMEAASKKQSHTARNEIEVHHMLTNFSNHPNIVALHDSFRQKDMAYLVMENCAGGDLFEFISQNGGMDEHDAKTLFRRIASAVSHCHEHGVVHLDIKPENLFFKVSPSQLDTIKLGDFGSAKVLDKNKKSATGGALSCTVGYAAPEVLEKGEVSFAADVFSAGAVLYTILCGYSPFSAPSEEEMLERTLSGEIFFEELEWWRMSKEAKELVLQMMHPDAEKRPSMEEVLAHPWFQKW